MIEDLKTTLQTALAMCEFAKCSHASIENTNIQEILRIISDYEDLKQQFYYLDTECCRLERAEQNRESETQEYHDFLESLADFLIWDTGKRAREARYKIEAFLKRMGEKEKMWTDGITEVIDSIKKELKQSGATEYICNDGTVIHTDVGYIEDWFNKYEQVLRRRMENKHDGT